MCPHELRSEIRPRVSVDRRDMHAGMRAMPLPSTAIGRGVPTGMVTERHALWGSRPVNGWLNMLDIPNRRKQSESAVVAAGGLALGRGVERSMSA
jgi:hypothetical protein